MSNMNVANEINRQIKAMDFWCHAYIGVKQAIAMERDGKPGLTYICTRGVRVEILLNEGQDLYEVYSYKMGRGANRYTPSYKYQSLEVFIDELSSVVCKAYDTAIN